MTITLATSYKEFFSDDLYYSLKPAHLKKIIERYPK